VTAQPTDGRFRDLTVDAFVDRLSSSDPVPGGGSAAAIAASLGASLVAMVATLSAGRPKYAAHEAVLAWAAETGQRLANGFLDLAQEDADAYAVFSSAMKLPRETDPQIAERTTAMQAAARRAAEVPMRCVEACVDLVAVAEALAGRSNVNASSDLNVAALLGEAAARGAAANVLVNLPSIGDPVAEGEMTIKIHGLLNDVEALATAVRQIVLSREPREPMDPQATDTPSLGGDASDLASW